jgi:hypothetical protein
LGAGIGIWRAHSLTGLTGWDTEWTPEWAWALRRRCVWPSVLCNVVWEEDRRLGLEMGVIYSHLIR